jgi:hypothetical protein
MPHALAQGTHRCAEGEGEKTSTHLTVRSVIKRDACR